MDHPLHILAAAQGVTPGKGCTCIVCGASPFDAGRPAADLLGPLFTDYDLLQAPEATDACAGCASVLGGKPGSVPMPLRMGHFAVVAGELLRPSGAELLDLLLDPPVGLQVIAWTATRQRHASLRCGRCEPGLLMVGTEQGTVAWDVDVGRQVAAAVQTLRGAAQADHVLTGQYPPHVILALGAAWEPAEAVVAAHRPSPLLDMVCALVRRPETSTTTESPMPIAESERLAGELILTIGRASAIREADPIAFWATTMPRRVAAAGTRPTLIDAAGWLVQQVRANPSALGEALGLIESMTPEQSTHTLDLWRDRALVCVAFARQLQRERNEERL